MLLLSFCNLTSCAVGLYLLSLKCNTRWIASGSIFRCCWPMQSLSVFLHYTRDGEAHPFPYHSDSSTSTALRWSHLSLFRSAFHHERHSSLEHASELFYLCSDSLHRAVFAWGQNGGKIFLLFFSEFQQIPGWRTRPAARHRFLSGHLPAPPPTPLSGAAARWRLFEMALRFKTCHGRAVSRPK